MAAPLSRPSDATNLGSCWSNVRSMELRAIFSLISLKKPTCCPIPDESDALFSNYYSGLAISLYPRTKRRNHPHITGIDLILAAAM